ncbi:MAG: glycosyltransferase domain-containing protein [Pseudomonadota bacterium]
MDIVYTCVVGGYDRLRPDAASTSRSCDDFVCFADAMKSLPSPWRQQSLARDLGERERRRTNRWHKLFPHELFPGARASLYRDGNLELSQNYADYIAAVRDVDAALGVFRHPRGRSVAEEVLSCREQDKFSPRDLERIDAQLASYALAGFDLDTPISANYLLVRNHEHPGLAEAMLLWWEELERHTGRDQLSLPYVLWKTGLPFVWLDDRGLPPPQRHPHSGERWRKRWHRLRRWLGT